MMNLQFNAALTVSLAFVFILGRTGAVAKISFMFYGHLQDHLPDFFLQLPRPFLSIRLFPFAMVHFPLRRPRILFWADVLHESGYAFCCDDGHFCFW